MHQRQPPVLAEINVVPYIDVMLVLLVIFMITAPLLTPGIEVSLPQAKTKVLPHQREPIIVSVDARGHYYLNTRRHPGQALKLGPLQREVYQVVQRRTKQVRHTPPVYIKGDRRVAYGKLVTLMNTLKQAGVAEVGLVTDLT